MTEPAVDAAGLAIELASKTDVGQVRSANEDSCETASRSDGAQLLVVADGMGGHRGGATASRTAVETIRDRFEANTSASIDSMLREAIESANARIFDMAQADPDLEGMGTTVVAFVLDSSHRATVAHVGDSRAYRYRRGHLEPLTIDHSVVAEMQKRGLLSEDEAATHPRRNEILRSVGVLGAVEVEVASVEIRSGDRFLLCSDGLSGVVSNDEIAAAIQSNTPREAVDALIQLANDRGGPDNITVQILSLPASTAEGDPEATAPVELSEFGIEAIENRRRARLLMQRAGMLILGLVVLAAAFLAWQFMTSEPTPRDATVIDTGQPEAPSPESPSLPAVDPEAPRRGIPR